MLFLHQDLEDRNDILKKYFSNLQNKESENSADSKGIIRILESLNNRDSPIYFDLTRL